MDNALKNWNEEDEADNLFGPSDTVITTRPTARITGGRKPYTGPITLSNDDPDKGSELAKVKTMQGVTVKAKKKKEKRKNDGSVWGSILDGIGGIFGGDSSAPEKIVYVDGKPTVQKKDNTLLYIGAGLAVLVIIYLMMKKK